MPASWEWHTFDSLSNKQVYDILRLREAIFQVEQNCAYHDIDGVDLDAEHLLGYKDSELVAYARCYLYDKKIRIGRVVVSKAYRGKGLAREMMNLVIKKLKDSPHEIALSGQSYLQKFYESLDFEAIGETYLEDGIPHIFMVYRDN